VDLGVRLQLLVGQNIPVPARYEVVDALVDLEVRNNDNERDTFQLTFAVGKDSLPDYRLLRSGLFEPPSRVTVIVLLSGVPQVLINGVVTDHQLAPSGRPGSSVFSVRGEDMSFEMDREDRNATHANSSDSDIVKRIVERYGLRPEVTTVSDTPTQEERIPSAHETDLGYVRRLAARHGFVFYVEPSAPGRSTAYWGPQQRTGRSQPPLTVGMGPESTVDRPINFNFDAFAAASPEVTIFDATTGQTIKIPVPAALLPALSGRSVAPLRTERARDAANLDPIQAGLRALATSSRSADSVTARGELDAVRYGQVLRSRRLVDVRGAGGSYDGTYYVQQVVHQIGRGSYTQSFTLLREGRDAASSRLALL